MILFFIAQFFARTEIRKRYAILLRFFYYKNRYILRILWNSYSWSINIYATLCFFDDWKAMIKTKNWINAKLNVFSYWNNWLLYFVDANKLLKRLYLSKISHLNSFSTSSNGFRKGWWPSKLLALAEVWSRRTSYIFSCSNLSWSCWSMEVVR